MGHQLPHYEDPGHLPPPMYDPNPTQNAQKPIKAFPPGLLGVSVGQRRRGRQDEVKKLFAAYLLSVFVELVVVS